MIKPAKIKSVTVNDINQNKIDIEIIKNDVKNLKEETRWHNNKTDDEFKRLHHKIDKIDSRIYAIAGLIIATTVGKMIADMWFM
tara:strand:+ start:64 stop:315 length:252 start_codon:yes stop_codon:yes gene_type:complete